MLLNNVQYSIDYYQRDYNWKSKNVEELVVDLTSKFLDSYRPEHVRSDVADYRLSAIQRGVMVPSSDQFGLPA